jgi:hypothetical protein
VKVVFILTICTLLITIKVNKLKFTKIFHMTAEITINSVPIGQSTRVTGFVGINEVITLSNSVAGEWRVSGSSCLPGDIGEAAAYLQCMQRSFARAREHGAPISV